MTPELSRKVKLAEIEKKPVDLQIEASEEELAALKARLGLLDMPAFSADLRLSVEAPMWYRIQAWFKASVVQQCVRTLEPMPHDLEIETELRVTSDPSMKYDDSATDDEVGVEMTGDEYEFTSGEEIDCGEMIVQQLALALDPYPRKEDAKVETSGGVEVVWDADSRPAKPAVPQNGDDRQTPFANLAAMLADKSKKQ